MATEPLSPPPPRSFSRHPRAEPLGKQRSPPVLPVQGPPCRASSLRWPCPPLHWQSHRPSRSPKPDQHIENLALRGQLEVLAQVSQEAFSTASLGIGSHQGDRLASPSQGD
eukprot:9838048-Alexandrium_andersonii.AAC.1